MTRKHFYIVAIIVAVFALGVFVGYNNNGGTVDSLVVDSAVAQTPRDNVVATWEYKVLINERIAEFNRLGSEGWELVTATASIDRNNAYYFKRPKP